MREEQSTNWRGVSWGCLAVALYAGLTLCLIAIRGGEWDILIAVNHPKRRMAVAALAVAGWYLLRGGRVRRPLRDWAAMGGRLALVGLSLAVSLAAAEMALRAVLRRARAPGSPDALARAPDGEDFRFRSFHPLAAIVRLSPNKRLVYELAPGLNRTFGGKTLRTNRAGLRADREIAARKPPGVVRLVGIGDSGMFGWSVNQGEDYLAVLERNLRRRGRTPVEVLNLAVPGYNTFQEVEMLRDRGLAYQPDVVIVGWNDNDVAPPFLLVRPADFSRRDASFLYCLLFDRTRFRALLVPEALRPGEVDPRYADPAALAGAGEDGVRKALAELRRLGREHGFRVLVFGAMGQAARALCAAAGVDYVNTRQAIPAGRYPAEFRVHYMHPTVEGYRVLADVLEDALDRRGWLAP